MRNQVVQRYTNVKADNAAEFAAMLDEALKVLKINEQPQIDRNVPYLAHIFYVEQVDMPENIKDEYEQRGERYYCSDCPYFNKPNNHRTKYVKCGYRDALVSASKPACVMFYQRLHDGLLEVDWNE